VAGLQLKLSIREAAHRRGFFACGFAEATYLEASARYLEDWLNRNQHGQMDWLNRNFDKRVDPRELVPGTRTVVSVLKNYYPYPSDELPADGLKVAKYAWGEDYHHLMRHQLQGLLEDIRDLAGPVEGRAFVDSAPVLDKVWAQRAGLGWIGKNTNLLRQQSGSFFLIGELLIDLPIPPDEPVTDHCGSCTACIDACPTDALTPYEIDARRCISYHTIELRSQIPDAFRDKLDGWSFGCDICQDVCPWNRFSVPHTEPAFRPLDILLQYSTQDWVGLSGNQFKKQTQSSPLSRITKTKLLDTLAALGKLDD